MQHKDHEIVIVGGGPAGSVAGAYLARMGFSVCIIEKKEYPREVLCGEFLSREVLQILTDLGLRDQFLLLKPNPITSFRYCPEYPRTFSAPLPFTGYGLKRGAFDLLLLHAAQQAGAEVIQPASVEQIDRVGSGFELKVRGGDRDRSIRCGHVIVAYGKFNVLDKTLRRSSVHTPSSLNGIKFHVPRGLFVDLPGDEIQIFTAEGLYCGVNVVNDQTVTVCFLEKRTPADLPPRERLAQLITTNRHFGRIVAQDFTASLGSLPIYGTSNIYFGDRSVTENGMMMIGDAAAVIAPLAGDGIGMAMQSGKLAAESFQEARRRELSSEAMLRRYSEGWHASFSKRLRTSGMIQRIFLTDMGRVMSPRILSIFPGILSPIIERTRG